VEKITLWETPQKDSKKEKIVQLENTDSLLIEAALEFGADYLYEIKNGTMGPSLYIQAPNKHEASRVRKTAPGHWNGLYVVVLYHTEPFSGSSNN
jgi:hypothetical protein